ncbi:MAG: hypothetical protein ACREAB_12090 [Blastocatellia bacterium]
MKNLFLKSMLTPFMILVALSAVTIGGYVKATQDTPESVAKAYFAAMKSGDWAKCASLMHPDALASMKRTFAAVVTADKTGEAAKGIFGLKSKAEYAQLSEEAVFERLMGFITGALPDMKTALAASTSTVLGRVDENPDLAHIVYRTQIKLAGAEVSEVEMISFKKHGATWRALLTSDMEEMLTKFAEGMTPAQKEEEKSAPAGARKPERKP